MKLREHRAVVHETIVAMLEPALGGLQSGPLFRGCVDAPDRARRSRAVREQVEWHRRRAETLRAKLT